MTEHRLQPGLHPSESFRAALKKRVMREATTTRGPSVRADAGSRDDDGGPLLHTHITHDPYLGVTVTAVDLEPVSEETAVKAARFLAGLHNHEQHDS